MSLAIFFQKHGYVLKAWYTTDSNPYVELISGEKAVPILLSIPTSFASEVPSDAISLTRIPTPNLSDSIENFTKASEPFIEQAYNSSNHSSLPALNSHQPISSHLETSYKHPIVMETSTEEFQYNIKLISRQLGRLKYCVQGVPQRIACINGSILAILTDDNRIKIYESSKSVLNSGGTRLYILIDLHIFHDKVETIENEANQVLLGINKILTHTQESHVQNVEKLIDKLPSITEMSDKLLQMKSAYATQINKYVQLLGDYKLKQDNLEVDRGLVEQRISTASSAPSFSREMSQTNELKKLNEKINKCRKARQEIFQVIEKLRTDSDRLALSLDHILFDNIVMINHSLRNFESLQSLK